jgi:hypothetical protein
MAPSQKENKAYVGCWIARDTHSALVQFATSRGIDPTELAGQLISEGLTELYSYKVGTLSEPNPRMELHDMYLQSRQRGLMRQQLVALAINIIQTSVTEQYIDNVERLAEENGFDFDEIRSEAQNLTRISSNAIFVTETDGNVGNAARILASLFGSRALVPVLEIEAIATKSNLSMNTIRMANRQMGLVSVRKGKSWFWEVQYIVAPSLVESKV